MQGLLSWTTCRSGWVDPPAGDTLQTLPILPSKQECSKDREWFQMGKGYRNHEEGNTGTASLLQGALCRGWTLPKAVPLFFGYFGKTNLQKMLTFRSHRPSKSYQANPKVSECCLIFKIRVLMLYWKIKVFPPWRLVGSVSSWRAGAQHQSDNNFSVSHLSPR